MRRFLTIILLCTGCLSTVCAQTFTKRLRNRTASGAQVIVTHSKEIDDLVNGVPSAPPPTTPTTPTVPTVPAETQEYKTEEKRSTAATTPTPEPHISISRDTVSIAERTEPVNIDTRKKVMKGASKVNGYRVQVFAGGNQRKDRQQAEQAGSKVKSHFPDQPIYVHFYSPRWICRMGNYRTYEEAHQMLNEIKKLGYTSATIVKGKITVYQ